MAAGGRWRAPAPLHWEVCAVRLGPLPPDCITDTPPTLFLPAPPRGWWLGTLNPALIGLKSHTLSSQEMNDTWLQGIFLGLGN